MNETLNTISTRYSCRQYKPDTLTDDELKAILLAGIQAPSAMNKQLCEAFAITKQDLINELSNAVTTIFKIRGKDIKDDYHFAYHAPVLVIVSGPGYDTRYKEDGSCMLENIFLAATSLNIGSCWINQLRDTQETDEVRKVLTKIGIPKNHVVVGCAALGYPVKQQSPKEKNIERIHIVK